MKVGNSQLRRNSKARARLGASIFTLAVLATSTPTLAQQAGADASDDSTPAIVVTGRRAALQNADDRKKNAVTIVDSVVADEAGKLPDNSITEVLQRVAGVTIVRFAALNDPDHFSVEGSGIQVRGLSGVASRLNGREVFSANAGRSLLWGDVTPELMKAVDVYKSSTADQIEGGTGGSVDLRTKLPFDYGYGLHFAGSADVGYGDLARATDYSMSGLVAGKWHTGIGDIGILVDGAYSKLTSNSHFIRMEPFFKSHAGSQDYYVPGGFDFGEQLFERKRDGLYAAVQWAPSDSLKLTGIYFQSRYRSSGAEWATFVTSHNFAVNPATSTFDSYGGLISTDSLFLRNQNTFQPGGVLTTGGTSGLVNSRTKTQDFSLAMDFTPSGSRFSAHGSFQHIKSTSKVDDLRLFREFNYPSNFSLDLSGNLPVISTPSSLTSDQLNNLANYQWLAAMPHNEDNSGKMDAAQLDLEYELDGSFFKSVKAGGRWSRRTERDFNNGFAWSALGRGWNGDPQLTFADAVPGDIDLHSYGDFFHGAIPAPASQYYPSLALAGTFDPQLVHDRYGGQPGRAPGFIPQIDQGDFSTETWAGYLMSSFGADHISGNVGARIVHLTNESSGYLVANPQTFTYNGNRYELPGGAIFRGGKASFTRLLPAMNVTWSPSDPIKVRAAYNRTLDLPSFEALKSTGTLSVKTTANPEPSQPGILTGFESNTGDPLLKPATSDNFDLSFEWYPRNGTTFHVAAFYKRINNLPIYSAAFTPISITVDGDVISSTANIKQTRNSDEAATVKGIEIGGRIFFDKLPGILRGLGIEGNYTYISSSNKGDTYRDINGVERNDLPIQGLSKHNFNVTLLYEHNPFSVRVAYSWRSKYLQSTNANGTVDTYDYYSAPGVSQNIAFALPVYGANFGSLDAGITVHVNEHVSASIQGTNLTNATTKTLQGGYPNPNGYGRSWFQSDRRVTMGLNLAF